MILQKNRLHMAKNFKETKYLSMSQKNKELKNNKGKREKKKQKDSLY